jgi:ABC-type glycerol-3-phosphate transport system substrate-binding protein
LKKEYMPLYMRIKSDIINKITAGELKKGDRLPSERVLAKTFRVSRVTIVGALSELAKEGIIKKIQGSGSYIDCDFLKEDYSDIFTHITSKATTEISFGVFKPNLQYEFTIKTLARVFQLENPDVRVKVVAINPAASDVDDVYLLKIGSGEAPTVGEFFLHADYAAINGLMPLENMPGFQELTESLYPQCYYQTRNANGEEHVHALASKINTRVIWANVDLMNKAGIKDTETLPDMQTLAEWVRILGQYTSRQKTEHYGCFMDIPFGWHGIIGNFPYLWSAQEQLMENHSLEAYVKFIESMSCHRGFDFMTNLYASGNPAPINGLDLFALGRVGMVLSSSCWPIVLNKLMVEKFNIKAYLIPSETPGVPARSVMGNYSLGVFRSAVKSEAELEAAWKWIKFLFRKKQQFLQTSDYSFPAVKKLPSALQASCPELASVFEDSLLRSNPQFDFRNIRKALIITGEGFKQCVADQKPSRQCIAGVLEQLKNL